MNRVQTVQVPGSGERCWGIRLLDESGVVVVVESTVPLTKGAAHVHAKALKHGAAGEIGTHGEPDDGVPSLGHRRGDLRSRFQRVLDEVFDGRRYTLDMWRTINSHWML